jgi:predicted  nucleic acid-binding Zn-ribbon protein
MIDFQQMMEVKTEIDDQSADYTTVSIMKIYTEMSEKYAKLQQEFVGLRKENAEMKKEMAELKEEMARNDQKYKRQMVMLTKIWPN